MVQYSNATMERFFGSPTAIATARVSGNHLYRRLAGSAAKAPRAASGQRRQTSRDRPERGTTSTFNLGGLFRGNYSQPSLRAEKTPEANLRAAMHLKKAFGPRKLGEISADDVEFYLRRRLRDRVRIKAQGFEGSNFFRTATFKIRLRIRSSGRVPGCRQWVVPAALHGWAEQQADGVLSRFCHSRACFRCFLSSSRCAAS
jgi:hypothetical protein